MLMATFTVPCLSEAGEVQTMTADGFCEVQLATDSPNTTPTLSISVSAPDSTKLTRVPPCTAPMRGSMRAMNPDLSTYWMRSEFAEKLSPLLLTSTVTLPGVSLLMEHSTRVFDTQSTRVLI
jgi:hypothetical protein